MDHWRKKFGDTKAETVRTTIEEKLRTVGYEMLVGATQTHHAKTYPTGTSTDARYHLPTSLIDS
jgi:hypothetical protein